MTFCEFQYFLFAQEKPLPLERLDDATRAKVFAALAGLIILGVGMMLLTWLGARVTRRYMNPRKLNKPRDTTLVDHEDWASKPLVNLDEDEDVS